MKKSYLGFLRVTFAVLAVVLCFAGVAKSQTETGTVSGLVTDSTGAVVVGADVQLQATDTGVVSNTKTNGAGLYAFATVKPGKYQIKIQKNGFKQVDFLGLIVNVQDHIEQNFRMELGSVSETVTVTGGTSLLNMENATVATTIDRTFMENIPLNGRSFQSLIFLAPGITPVPPATLNTNGEFSVNGQRTDANGFTVDGVDANFANGGGTNQAATTGNIPGFSVLGTTQTLASVDAVQEFKIQTSSYAAEFGPHPGGQISIVTRSGTNAYHGTAFDYLRNTIFDANNWFSNRAATTPGVLAVRSPEHQNDFGGVFGGPVRIPGLYNGHDKTFFFFSYEGLRLLVPAFTTTSVPGLCLRGQSASECTSLNASNPSPLFMAAPSAFLPILSAFPLPQAGSVVFGAGENGFGTYAAGYSNPTGINTTSIRVDHTINSKVTVFGRFQNSPSQATTRSTGNLSYESTQHLNTWTLTGGATILITPSTSNDFRINLSSNPSSGISSQTTFGGTVPVMPAALIPPSLLGSNGTFGLTFNFLGVLAPFPLVSTVGVPATNAFRLFNIVDSVSHPMGPHQFKFGGTLRRVSVSEKLAPLSVSADFTASPNTVAADLNQLYASQINATTNPSGVVLVETGQAFPVSYNYSFFAQDTWKISRRLTFDYGVRWDIDPAPSNANGNHALGFNEIANLSTAQLQFLGRPYPIDWRAISPRLGFAYQLRQSPGWETVVRGGFGTFYDTGNQFSTIGFQSFPYTAQIVVGPSVEPLNFPFVLGTGAGQLNIPTIPASLTLPLAAGTTLPTTASNLAYYNPNFQLPLTKEWNVAVQQALGRSQTFTVTYVGSQAPNLPLEETILNSAVKNPQFLSSAGFRVFTNGTHSNYNALQAQFNRRLSHGIQALVGYTWAHSLDSDSTDRTGVAPQYGNSSFDIRQILTVAMTLQPPAPTHNKVVRAILGGWSADSTFHAETGPPVDLIATTFTDVTGNTFDQRPDVVPGIPFYTSGNCTPPAKPASQPIVNTACPGDRQINFTPNAFTLAQGIAAGCATKVVGGQTVISSAAGPFCLPLTGVNGDLGRNQLRQLGAWQLDEAIQRDFKVTERVNLTFRAEGFNVFNHPNFGPPNTTLTSATFGQATTMLSSSLSQGSQFSLYALGGPRSLQMSLKLRF